MQKDGNGILCQGNPSSSSLWQWSRVSSQWLILTFRQCYANYFLDNLLRKNVVVTVTLTHTTRRNTRLQMWNIVFVGSFHAQVELLKFPKSVVIMFFFYNEYVCIQTIKNWMNAMKKSVRHKPSVAIYFSCPVQEILQSIRKWAVSIVVHRFT